MTSLITTLIRRANSFMKIPESFSAFQRTFTHLKPITDSSNALLLRPQLPSVTQTCGFKVKLKLKKRCKDCYFVVRNERTYVLCPTHPRHKQMSMIKKEKYTWILTHACQSKVRPW